MTTISSKTLKMRFADLLLCNDDDLKGWIDTYYEILGFDGFLGVDTLLPGWKYLIIWRARDFLKSLGEFGSVLRI